MDPTAKSAVRASRKVGTTPLEAATFQSGPPRKAPASRRSTRRVTGQGHRRVRGVGARLLGLEFLRSAGRAEGDSVENGRSRMPRGCRRPRGREACTDDLDEGGVRGGAVAAAKAGDRLGMRLAAGGPVARRKVEDQRPRGGAGVGALDVDDVFSVLVEADRWERWVGGGVGASWVERRLAEAPTSWNFSGSARWAARSALWASVAVSAVGLGWLFGRRRRSLPCSRRAPCAASIRARRLRSGRRP